MPDTFSFTRSVDMPKVDKTRMNKGMTLTEFCKEAGISIKTYNKLMKQPDSKVKDATIFRICKEAGISPSEVLEFKE